LHALIKTSGGGKCKERDRSAGFQPARCAGNKPASKMLALPVDAFTAKSYAVGTNL